MAKNGFCEEYPLRKPVLADLAAAKARRDQARPVGLRLRDAEAQVAKLQAKRTAAEEALAELHKAQEVRETELREIASSMGAAVDERDRLRAEDLVASGGPSAATLQGALAKVLPEGTADRPEVLAALEAIARAVQLQPAPAVAEATGCSQQQPSQQPQQQEGLIGDFSTEENAAAAADVNMVDDLLAGVQLTAEQRSQLEDNKAKRRHQVEVRREPLRPAGQTVALGAGSSRPSFGNRPPWHC